MNVRSALSRAPGIGATMALSARRIVLVIIMCFSALAASLATEPALTQAATSAAPMAFGIFPGDTKASTVQTLESTTGRPYAYIRVYRSWNDNFPDVDINWMKSSGHSLFLSVKARLKNGTNVSYQAIADSQPGDALYQNMVRWATAIKAYGLPIFVAFNHEPDTSNSQKSGTATQFIAAWRKWVSVMDSEGVTNAHWAYTTAVRSYSVSTTSSQYAPKFYPGDSWIDDIAVDAYNMYCLRKDGTFANPWRSLATLLAPFMTFVAGHPGIPLVLAEFGSPEDPNQSGRKAQWISDAQQMFQQVAYQRFIAVSYWNTLSHNYAGCDFRITSSTSALNAFKTMANDPFYAGPVS
jgi:hypothetical protein